LKGRIEDYSAANHYLKQIMSFGSDKWEDLEKEFRPTVKKYPSLSSLTVT
jgi:hypothetical protein